MILIENLHADLDGKPVLKGVTASLEPGRVIALLGPNGAGKTTLLRLLAGLLPMKSGVISRDGQKFVNTDPRWISSVAFVSDRNDLFPELSALEHFELARLLSDLDRTEAGRRAETLLTLMRIGGEERDIPARQLSFGFRKRLALALCLFLPARLYLFDEPSTGLDIESMAIFERIVGFLRRAGRTLLIATHDLTWIKSLTDARLVMEEGFLPPSAGSRGDSTRREISREVSRGQAPDYEEPADGMKSDGMSGPGIPEWLE